VLLKEWWKKYIICWSNNSLPAVRDI
jgi:hypothetical protein